MGDATERSWADTAHEVTDRAQAAAERATSYVRDTAERADDQITKVTGRPLAVWTTDVKEWVTRYPLQGAVLALGLGYVLGRMIRRY
jgi:hypothetical protein